MNLPWKFDDTCGKKSRRNSKGDGEYEQSKEIEVARKSEKAEKMTEEKKQRQKKDN